MLDYETVAYAIAACALLALGWAIAGAFKP